MGAFTNDAKKKLLAQLTDEELAKLYEYKLKGIVIVSRRPKENFEAVMNFLGSDTIPSGNFFGPIHLLVFQTYRNDKEAVELILDSIRTLKEKLAILDLPRWFSCYDEDLVSAFSKIEIPAPKADIIIHPALGEVKLKYEFNGKLRWHAFERFCSRTQTKFSGRATDFDFLEEALINSFKRSKPTNLPIKHKVLRGNRGQTRSGRRGGGKAVRVAVSFETLRMMSNDFEEAEYFLDEELGMRYVVVKAKDGSKILKTAEKPYSN